MMAARSFRGCALTTSQSEALTAVGVSVVSDTSCTSPDLNTCALRAIYEKTGTYFQSGNTITVTIANHGLSTGTLLDLLFTTGESTSGRYAIKVTDDDTFTVTTTGNLRKGNFFTTESGGTNTFTVSLNTRPTADVTITFSGLDTTEGSLSPTTLTFTEANWYTPQTVTVTGVNDIDADGDVFYTLTATASNTGGYAGTETAIIPIVNQENDAPNIPPITTIPVANQNKDIPGIIITPTGTLITSGDVKAYRIISDARDLLSFYDLYDPGKGLYSEWGDIPWPWNHEDALSDERWQVSTYVDTQSYRTGDTVIRIEDDGRRLVVYTATSNVPVPAGAFNPDLWSETCHIVVAEPIGLPSITDLESQYEYYRPEAYITEWGDFAESWSTDLTSPDSDEWDSARIAKQFFYRSGDTVLYETPCGNYTCVYVATSDMPANPALVVPGPPPTAYWQRQYCVENGTENKCEKTVVCGPGYTVVDLGGNSPNLVCVPVESTVGVGPRGYESLR